MRKKYLFLKINVTMREMSGHKEILALSLATLSHEQCHTESFRQEHSILVLSVLLLY